MQGRKHPAAKSFPLACLKAGQSGQRRRDMPWARERNWRVRHATGQRERRSRQMPVDTLCDPERTKPDHRKTAAPHPWKPGQCSTGYRHRRTYPAPPRSYRNDGLGFMIPETSVRPSVWLTTSGPLCWETRPIDRENVSPGVFSDLA
ncbi:hypothetical protein D9M69_246750 [compost metagenome]